MGLVKVKFNMSEYILNLYVIENGRPPLLGRVCMEPLKINNRILIFYKNDVNYINDLIIRFPEVFTDKLGTYLYKSKM